MNATMAPYTDVRVRQAMGRLLDREEIIRSVFFGSGWKSPMMFTRSFSWLMPDAELDSIIGYDPQKTRQLLSAAGIDPASIKFTLTSGAPFARSTGISELFVSDLKRLGANADIQPIENQEVIDTFTTAKTAITMLNDPAPRGTNLHLYNYFHSSGGLASYWKALGDTEFDRLIDAQAVIVDDPERRKSTLLEAVRHGITQAVANPSIAPTDAWAFQARLAGFKHNTQEPLRFAFAWLRA